MCLSARILLTAISSLLTITLVQCTFEMLILHTNDMHSRFDETDVNGQPLQSSSEPVYGGFARLKTAVDQSRAEAASRNIPSLFLNAGDTFVGTAFYSMLKNKVVSSLIPLLGIDVMSLGNHEFDDGVTPLAKYLSDISVPVVACNLNFTAEKSLQLPNLTPSKILHLNDRKIGIVGYLVPETKNFSITGNVTFSDEIESISREAKLLKSQGINIIIALGHSGFQVDKKIASSVPEISLVVGGHDHELFYNPPDHPPSTEQVNITYPWIETQPNGKKVPIVQAFAFTKYLGKLWTTFDDDGNFISVRPESNPLLLDSSIAKDSLVQEVVQRWRKEFEKEVHTVIGRTNVNLDGWKSGCRVHECNLGNLVTDAFVDAAASQYDSSLGWTDAPIALIQGGSLRSAIAANKTHGNFTYEEILTMLPYKTPMYKVRVRGSDLRTAMELSIGKQSINGSSSRPTGEFLQVSGIHVVYDLSKPVYHRVSKLDVRCANCSIPEYSPLSNKTTYTVVMSQFLRDGGDGYSMFKSGYSEPIMEDGYVLSDTDAVAKYFKKLGVNYPEIQGRITILKNASESCIDRVP